MIEEGIDWSDPPQHYYNKLFGVMDYMKPIEDLRFKIHSLNQYYHGLMWQPGPKKKAND